MFDACFAAAASATATALNVSMYLYMNSNRIRNVRSLHMQSRINWIHIGIYTQLESVLGCGNSPNIFFQ